MPFIKPAFSGSLSIEDPTDLDDIVLWLDASDSTTLWTDVSRTSNPANGETIYHWDDKSGESHHVLQAGGNNQPTYRTNVKNGLAVVRASTAGVDDQLERTGAVLSQTDNVTIFGVWLDRTAVNFSVLVSTKRTGGTHTGYGAFTLIADTRDQPSNSSIGFKSDGTVNAGTSTSSNTLENIFHYTTLRHTNNSTIDGWANGEPTPSYSTAAVTGTPVNTGLYLFATDYLGYGQTDGDIAEIIIYDRSLSNIEVAAVHNYLTAKWDL